MSLGRRVSIRATSLNSLALLSTARCGWAPRVRTSKASNSRVSISVRLMSSGAGILPPFNTIVLTMNTRTLFRLTILQPGSRVLVIRKVTLNTTS